MTKITYERSGKERVLKNPILVCDDDDGYEVIHIAESVSFGLRYCEEGNPDVQQGIHVNFLCGEVFDYFTKADYDKEKTKLRPTCPVCLRKRAELCK